MTLKIETASAGEAAVLRLVGRIQSDDVDELRSRISGQRAKVVLDLDEVTLVDLEAVEFLVACEGEGVELLRCPPYIGNGWAGSGSATFEPYRAGSHDPSDHRTRHATGAGPDAAQFVAGLAFPAFVRCRFSRGAATLVQPRHPTNQGATMDTTTSDGVPPTIVLVHGAWADASGFDGEIRALRRQGYRAIGVANQLRELRSDAAYVAALLRTIEGPMVLVGHSYGGAVISNAATGNAQVKAQAA
jgi:hypothetical protein